MAEKKLRDWVWCAEIVEMVDKPKTSTDRQSTYVSVLLPTALLVLEAVICKAMNLTLSVNIGRSFFSDLLVVSYYDVAFMLGFGLIWQMATTLSNLTPATKKTQKVIMITFTTIGAFFAFYSVSAYRVYTLLWVPLTYRLMAVGGGMKGLWQSIQDAWSLGFILALIVAPAIFVLSSYYSHKRLFWSKRAAAATWVVALIVVTIYWQEGSIGQLNGWDTRPERSLVTSPHATLLDSLLIDRGLLHERPARGLDHQHQPADASDFHAPFGSPKPVVSTKPKGVIVYVLESVGAEYTEVYGGIKGVTPNLLKLAERSTVFEHAYANVGRTEGALATLTLSKYLPINWRPFTKEHTGADGVTLAALLQKQGYYTGFYSASDLWYFSQRDFLTGRGFDEIRDGKKLGCQTLSYWGVDDACLVDNLLATIDKHKDQPFFLVAWTNQTHHPYPVVEGRPKVKFEHERLPEQPLNFDDYLNALHDSDRQIGRLFAGLADRGLENDVLIVITGDHGEAFRQRHRGIGHGLQLFEEEMRVPLMVYWPNSGIAPTRQIDPASHLDVTPTLAHLLNIEQNPSWFGRSLFDPNNPRRAYMFAFSGDPLVGVRESNLKYSINLLTGREELYDMQLDPGEQSNLAQQQPTKTLPLRRKLSAWVSTTEQLWGVQNTERPTQEAKEGEKSSPPP